MTKEERNIEIALMLGCTKHCVYHNRQSDYKMFTVQGDICGKLRVLANMPVGEHYLKSILVDQLQFHSNWNWLMEGVEFIENLGYTFIIGEKHCYYYKELLRESKSGIGESKKEAVFTAVSDFAKMYNTKNNENSS
jgi:hypothetical protein